MDKELIEKIALLHKEEGSYPPVHLWNPPLCGNIAIRINTKGEWFHRSDLIKRESLVRLFASVLKKEDDLYFLVTPVEKWRIQVDDVPFVVVSVDTIEIESEKGYQFCTNFNDKAVLTEENPLQLRSHKDGIRVPYISVRNDLEAVINRSVFYDLANDALEECSSGRYYINSFARKHYLD